MSSACCLLLVAWRLLLAAVYGMPAGPYNRLPGAWACCHLTPKLNTNVRTNGARAFILFAPLIPDPPSIFKCPLLA